MKTQIAKPFLKWAGGKTQLITDIQKALPREFTSQKFTYVEPFVGSGAILFWILNNFPNVEKAVINDINADLTNAYIDDLNNKFNINRVLNQRCFNVFRNEFGNPFNKKAS